MFYKGGVLLLMKINVKYFLIVLILICSAAYYRYYENSTDMNEPDDFLIPTPSAFIDNAPPYIASTQDEIQAEYDFFKNEPSQGGDLQVPTQGPLLDIKDINSVIVLVNKSFGLPYDFVPNSLVAANVSSVRSGMLIRREIAVALKDMFEAAKAEGLNLILVSSYRSYQTQKSSYQNAIQAFGEEYTNRYYAPPGHSEHQTGLAVDISSPSFNSQLEEEFEHTKEGIWLRENSAKFGFILRYPRGKEHITGYSYEPWHFRYLRVDLATEITTSGLTMEEYFKVID
jgi:zinc D-Ala-D-Ala carboxypeptidase